MDRDDVMVINPNGRDLIFPARTLVARYQSAIHRPIHILAAALRTRREGTWHRAQAPQAAARHLWPRTTAPRECTRKFSAVADLRSWIRAMATVEVHTRACRRAWHEVSVHEVHDPRGTSASLRDGSKTQRPTRTRRDLSSIATDSMRVLLVRGVKPVDNRDLRALCGPPREPHLRRAVRSSPRAPLARAACGYRSRG